jgi:hypothetical protein
MQNNEFIGKAVRLTFPNNTVRVGTVIRRGRRLWVDTSYGLIDFGYYNSADGGMPVEGFRYTVALAE